MRCSRAWGPIISAAASASWRRVCATSPFASSSIGASSFVLAARFARVVERWSPGPDRPRDGAPRGATISRRLAAPRPLRTGARLSALHRGDFGLRDRTSGTRTDGSSPPLSRGFRPARPVPSSPCGRPPIVEADGDPTPPECVAANHARGRRTPLRHLDASRWRPHANEIKDLNPIMPPKSRAHATSRRNRVELRSRLWMVFQDTAIG